MVENNRRKLLSISVPLREGRRLSKQPYKSNAKTSGRKDRHPLYEGVDTLPKNTGLLKKNVEWDVGLF